MTQKDAQQWFLDNGFVCENNTWRNKDREKLAVIIYNKTMIMAKEKEPEKFEITAMFALQNTMDILNYKGGILVVHKPKLKDLWPFRLFVRKQKTQK